MVVTILISPKVVQKIYIGKRRHNYQVLLILVWTWRLRINLKSVLLIHKETAILIIIIWMKSTRFSNSHNNFNKLPYNSRILIFKIISMYSNNKKWCRWVGKMRIMGWMARNWISSQIGLKMNHRRKKLMTPFIRRPRYYFRMRHLRFLTK